MDWYLISVLIFSGILAFLIYKDRKNFKREMWIFLLRRTKKGKEFLTKLGTRFPRFWKIVGWISIIVCFFVSIWGFFWLIDTTINLFFTTSLPGLALVLPSPFSQPSMGPGYFAVPFWYWIISIALLALIHEGFHGIMAAREKVKIKSLGIGFLAIIPLAFVEPDEKQLEKKKASAQLRVYSMGSFGNFILALISLLILTIFSAHFFFNAGVAYQGYLAKEINITSINQINNYSVQNLNDIKNVLNKTEKDGLIEIYVKGGEKFYLTKDMFINQLNKTKCFLFIFCFKQEPEKIIVFEDYPAIKVNLTGNITKINNYTINNVTDLGYALEKIGPNKTIEIITTNGTLNKTFILKTVSRPEPKYVPDWHFFVLANFERIFPGTIEFSQKISDKINLIFGKEKEVNWQTIQYEIKFWEYLKENYPGLKDKAETKIANLKKDLENYPEPGFIGISGLYTVIKVKPGFEPYSNILFFLQGLFFFLFLINFGVGVANLLPIKPLDGGKMWEIFLEKFLPKYSKQIMSIISTLLIFAIILNLTAGFI